MFRSEVSTQKMMTEMKRDDARRASMKRASTRNLEAEIKDFMKRQTMIQGQPGQPPGYSPAGGQGRAVEPGVITRN